MSVLSLPAPWSRRVLFETDTGVDHVHAPAPMSTVSPSTAALIVACTSFCSQLASPFVPFTARVWPPATHCDVSKPRQSALHESFPEVNPGNSVAQEKPPRSVPSHASPGSATLSPHEA